jgi:DNA mismatch repair protein MutL
VIGKIAAGEVVQRPSSVVKELLENSLDAEAKKIVVEVKGGGKNLIRVVDDGFGMSSEDAVLAFERYATSKISTLSDLDEIRTFGFRGEALSSIASVSQVELITHADGFLEGTKVKVEGGKVKEIQSVGCPVGTTIVVRNLFFNTPARRKFLKSVPTEMGYVSSVVAQVAIAHPEVSFKLLHENLTIFHVQRTKNLLERIASFYGEELLDDLVEVDFTHQEVRIKGFVAKSPSVGKNFQCIFVNRRPVSCKLILHGIMEGYGGCLQDRRCPATILFLEIDPHLVDVNVHPTKREVRFVNQSKIHDLVVESIKDALKRSSLGGREERDSKHKFPHVQYEIKGTGVIQPITQFYDTYIIAQENDSLLIIDQHGAHERILFESLMESKGSSKVQNLLTPISLSLNYEESTTLSESLLWLRELGFEIEEFGRNSFLITGVPQEVGGKQDVAEIILNLIRDIQNFGKATGLKDITASLSCHAAVKAGDRLSLDEMNTLLLQLLRTTNPYLCPHGRPTLIKFTLDELKRKFERT